MGNSGGKGGGITQQQASQYGANPELNYNLSQQFGYDGGFGEGQFGEWAGQQDQGVQDQIGQYTQNFDPKYGQGQNAVSNYNLAQDTGYSGDFGGGQYQDWAAQQPTGGNSLGANQGLNQGLRDNFGYQGAFGGGGFDQWLGQQDAQTQRTVQGYIDNFQPEADPNSLANRTMQGLFGAQDWTQQWANTTPEQMSEMNLQPYMNPYQQSVTDATMGEMQRQNEFQQDRLGDMAQQAGAFGGDRHGIAEAEMNRNFADQQQRWLAGHNLQNFNNAQQMGQFDINRQFQNKGMNLGAGQQMGNLANMGFGWGQDIQNQQRQAGMDQWTMQQKQIDDARNQFNMMQNQPYRNMQMLSGSLPGIGGAGSQTSGSTPGIMDYASTALQAYLMYQMCWVAREVYGTDDTRWLGFRKYMTTKAPNWAFQLYLRHGEKIAKTIKRLPWIKRIIRPVMTKLMEA